MPVSDRGLRIDGEILFNIVDGASTSIAGSYTAMSDRVENWSLSGNLTLPFTLFDGTAPSSTFGFSTTTSAKETLNAQARVSIPLN